MQSPDQDLLPCHGTMYGDVPTMQELLLTISQSTAFDSEWNFPFIFGKGGGSACEHLEPQ